MTAIKSYSINCSGPIWIPNVPYFDIGVSLKLEPFSDLVEITQHKSCPSLAFLIFLINLKLELNRELEHRRTSTGSGI